MAESMKGLKRTHRCAEVSAANIGEKSYHVWDGYRKERNIGGLIFVDLRDRSQVLSRLYFEEGKCEAALIEKAAKLQEVRICSCSNRKVEKRSGAVNDNLATGEMEVIPEELRILSESETPPFPN